MQAYHNHIYILRLNILQVEDCTTIFKKVFFCIANRHLFLCASTSFASKEKHLRELENSRIF